MAISYTSSALIQSQNSGGRIFLAVAFWLWGGVGLLINTLNFLTLSGSIGVGTSAYMAAGLLFWIGGMVLFGIGSLILSSSYDFRRPNPTA
jgi:hypothetical protein